jgi:RNA polymerase sigma factor (TIGR02999 family)
MPDVTSILNQLDDGDPNSASQLLSIVYEELRKLAAQRLASEDPGQTLQPTALVHDAWLRLVGDGDKNRLWDNRGHFFAAAAIAMKRILIERARRKKRLKHGGGLQRVELGDPAGTEADEHLLALTEALEDLAKEDPVAAKVVDLHHFAGLSHDDIAAVLGMSVYKARQKWTYARAWLRSAIEYGPPGGE